MLPVEACLTDLMTLDCEPLVTFERLGPVVQCASLMLGEISKCCVVCSMSPPTPELRLCVVAEPSRNDRMRVVLARNPFGARWIGHRRNPELWFELDENASATGRPAGMHVCAREGSDEVDRSEVFASLEELVASGELSPAARIRVESCLRTLPTESRLLRISLLAARVPMELSIGLAIPRDAFRSYLIALCGTDWGERVSALTPWMRARLVGSTVFGQLTFRSEALHKVGILYTQDRVMLGLESPSRVELRRLLVRDGLCNLAQDAALTTWVEPGDEPAHVERWLDLAVSLTRSRLMSHALLGFKPFA